MNLKITISLLGAIAIAGALLWIFQEDSSTRTPRSALFERMDPEQLNALRIVHAGEEQGWEAEFQRLDGRWHLVWPIESRADGAAIDRLVSVLESLDVGETITALDRRQRDLTLSDFELEFPHVSIELRSVDRNWTLSVGRSAPLGDSVYVRLGQSDDVLAVATNLLNVIPAGLEALRDRTVLSGDPSDVVRFEVERVGGSFLRLVKLDGRWAIQQPIQARADGPSVDEILEQLFSAQVIDFVRDFSAASGAGATASEDRAAFGLGDGEAVLQVTVWQNRDEAGQVVVVGDASSAESATRYASIAGQRMVFTVSSAVFDPVIQLGVHELRDHLVYALDPGQIAGVTFSEGEYKLALGRTEDGWRVVEPAQWTADRKLCERVIQEIATLGVSSYEVDSTTNLVEFGLDPAELSVDLVLTNRGVSSAPIAAAPPTLRFGKRREDGDVAYARFDGDSQLCTIDVSSLWPLIASAREETAQRFADPLHYFDRVMLSLDPQSVRGLQIHQEKGLQQSVIRAEDNTWSVQTPAKGTVRQEAVDDILIALAELRALRIEALDPENLAVFGLDQSPLVLTVELTESAGIQRRLILGFRSRLDGVFAMLQGQDLVFVLPVEMAATIGSNLVTPSEDDPPPGADDGDE
ncbi:MAG: DUF4340 domain-containing protein [Verrucomicrobia bacterium]|nr:DUF4340 domain-containing protein [Verrucomicrobiota bacterium]MDA1088276.1 DUF4340 domain-containing protein [Verrucomicrobiota bacterium]